VALAAFLAIGTPALAGGDTPAPDSAKAYFINLTDGDTVSNPVTIQFGLKGMGVSPAGIKDVANSGHHHLLINTTLDKKKASGPLPSDASHKHFGKGQTEATLELPAGKHTLQLVLGDWKHTPHTKPVTSEVITITVK
jgi:hypothetical protein